MNESNLPPGVTQDDLDGPIDGRKRCPCCEGKRKHQCPECNRWRECQCCDDGMVQDDES